MLIHDWFRLCLVFLLVTGAGSAVAGGLTIESIPVSDPLSPWFSKRVWVFGSEVVARGNVSDDKVLHAAGVMAQYLDGDEDGLADHPAVVAAMAENRATLIMFQNPNQLDNSSIWDSDVLDDRIAQDCLGDETNPASDFDASLEEVFHLVHMAGYAPVYQDLEPVNGTVLSQAMDIARGGHFESVPNNYPDQAWYHYDDETCTYDCQGTEYFYWGLTTLLGAQSERCEEIEEEWEPCTPALLQSTDSALYALLTDSAYGLPTRLPDGGYEVATAAVCGNALTESGEACDSGDLNGSDESCCTAQCQFKPNGVASCDGNVCTRSDQCTDGVCSPGSCDEDQPCSFCGGTCRLSGSGCACLP